MLSLSFLDLELCYRLLPSVSSSLHRSWLKSKLLVSSSHVWRYRWRALEKTWPLYRVIGGQRAQKTGPTDCWCARYSGPPPPQKPQQHHARCGAGKRIIHSNSIGGTNSAIKTSIDGLYLRHGTEFSVLWLDVWRERGVTWHITWEVNWIWNVASYFIICLFSDVIEQGVLLTVALHNFQSSML